MSFKITTLIENMPDTDGKLAYEHGFSVFIEFDGKKFSLYVQRIGGDADVDFE